MSPLERRRADYEHIATLLWSAAVDLKLAAKVQSEINEEMDNDPDDVVVDLLNKTVEELMELSEGIREFFQ